MNIRNGKVVSCPDPFRKNREGVWQRCHSTVCPVPRGLYSARQSDCRVQLRHVNRFVTILLQVGVVPFDKALIVSDVAERKKMGSRKLLLKQNEVAEAFASWRDAFVSFPISYTSTFATEAFSQHRYCYKEFV